MKRFLYIIIGTSFLFGSFFLTLSARAQVLPGFPAQPQDEAIINFSSNLVVNADNSVEVIEKIKYFTGPREHHGIYRDIDVISSQKRKMSIEKISVTDDKGNLYPFAVSTAGDNLRIKIGDPNQTFRGERTYIIKYSATDAVSQYKDFDEIYWNITGNDWQMPIYEAEATFSLPNGTPGIQSSCYYGLKGSSDKCTVKNSLNGYEFSAPSLLVPGAGLTGAVGFPKGIVTPYSTQDNISNFFQKYRDWLVAAFIPLATLIIAFAYWYKRGRDPKGTGVIVPQYDVPDGLTPMEVAGIIFEKVGSKDMSAEIIYLATKGYIKISQIDSKKMGIFKSTDYELTLLKESSDLPNGFDKKLLNYLFSPKSSILSSFLKAKSENQKTVKLSDLKKFYSKEISEIIKSVPDALKEKGYYKNLGNMKSSEGRILVFIHLSIFVPLFLGGILGTFISNGNPSPMMLSIFVAIVIYAIISQFFPAKTDKGIAAKEYLLGLKLYLQIAEKDRLEFHNAPEKKPEIFEKLLPYAMVLGVAKIWAKEFEGIYTAPPSWYSGSPGNVFSAIAFNNSISNFSSSTASSFSALGGSSGSGGGGFSGGGGGGGGGGSW